MNNQKRQLVSTPNSSSANRSIHEHNQESRYQIKKLEINPNHSGSEDLDSAKSIEGEGSPRNISERGNFYYYFSNFSPKQVSKKDILLGHQSIDILGRKSHKNNNDHKIHNLPESLIEIPTRDNDNYLNSQPADIPSKRPLKNLFRRKSCSCSCCGGISALEMKIQDLPAIPVPRAMKYNNPDIPSLDGKKMSNNLSVIKNKHEIGLRPRDKQYGKNGLTLKGLVVQARSSLNEVLSPKATPTNAQKFGYSANHIKGDFGVKTAVLESKEFSGEKVNTSRKVSEDRKIVNHQVLELSPPPVGDETSKAEKTAMLVEKKNQIAKLLKKKMTKKKRDVDDQGIKNMYYSVLRAESFHRTYKQVLPRFKIDSLLLKSQRGGYLEKTDEVPQELEEDKNIKTIKAKLGKITGKEKDHAQQLGIKKVNGMTSRLLKDQIKFQNNSNSYGSMTDRSRSLPVNKLPETVKFIKYPVDVRFTPQAGEREKEKEKEKNMKEKRPKLKLKKLDILSSSAVKGGIQSVRSPKSPRTSPHVVTLKMTPSAKAKNSAKNEWLVKNYNMNSIKPVKKD